LLGLQHSLDIKLLVNIKFEPSFVDLSKLVGLIFLFSSSRLDKGELTVSNSPPSVTSENKHTNFATVSVQLSTDHSPKFFSFNTDFEFVFLVVK